MTLLDKARNAATLDPSTYRIKALLIGHSGGGKTELGCSIPSYSGVSAEGAHEWEMQEGQTLLLDLDQRGATVAGREDCLILSEEFADFSSQMPTAYTNLRNVICELQSLAKKPETFPYTTVVLAGLTRLTDILQAHAIKMGGFATDWSKLPKAPYAGANIPLPYQQMKQVCAEIVSQVVALPCNVVVEAHLKAYFDTGVTTTKAKEVKGKDLPSIDEGITIRYFPLLVGDLRERMPHIFNETYLCQRGYRKGESVYEILTKGSPELQFFKSTLNQRGKFWDDPVTVGVDDPLGFGFHKLLNLRFNHKAD